MIVDVGTGSGCIAVALAVHLPQARLIATDASAGALALAAENAARHGVAERIAFRQGDLLQPVGERVDIIVSNPPYIPSAEIGGLQPEIARYEPRAALDGGADGLDIVRRLLVQAAALPATGRASAAGDRHRAGERGGGAGRRSFPGATIEIANDLAGLERYVFVRSVA